MYIYFAESLETKKYLSYLPFTKEKPDETTCHESEEQANIKYVVFTLRIHIVETILRKIHFLGLDEDVKYIIHYVNNIQCILLIGNITNHSKGYNINIKLHICKQRLYNLDYLHLIVFCVTLLYWNVRNFRHNTNFKY